MALRVLFFGSLQECTHTHALLCEVTADVVELQVALEKRYPCLVGKAYRFAVNAEICQGPTALADGDEIALMPPFAGG